MMTETIDRVSQNWQPYTTRVQVHSLTRGNVFLYFGGEVEVQQTRRIDRKGVYYGDLINGHIEFPPNATVRLIVGATAGSGGLGGL